MFALAAFVLALGLCGAAQTLLSVGMPFKMNCGGPALPTIGYTAEDSSLIASKPGFTFSSTAPVSVSPGANNMGEYKTERVAIGTLTYAFPTPPGWYTVSTMHAESYFSGPGKRKFSVRINGIEKEAEVDIFDRVGKNAALVLEFPRISPVDGVITVEFVPGIENPIVNAISRSPPGCSSGNSGLLLRLNAGGPTLPDILYAADDLALFTAVPAGICTAETLHSEGFVETYFNDAGKRRFAIFINNDISEKDVDVFDLVGKNSALELHFRSSPNPFGFIKIQLKKRVKNPMLSGIMISSAT